MAIYTQRPRRISRANTPSKLYATDEEYIHKGVRDGLFPNNSDAVRELVNEAVRIRRQAELGKDETMYAVVKNNRWSSTKAPDHSSKGSTSSTVNSTSPACFPTVKNG